MFSKAQKGFTLIEMMIVLAIIGILTAIAVPNYMSYVTEARRSDGQVALLDLATRADRYFTDNNTYVGVTLAGVGMPAASPEGQYNLQISAAGATSYTLQAAPTGSHAINDTECATLTYNELGQKGITGTGTAADCW